LDDRRVRKALYSERHQRLKADRERTVSFISQQNSITRQLEKALVERHKDKLTHTVSTLVNRRRTHDHGRREEVRQILFDNFARRRQVSSFDHFVKHSPCS
jgi:predicted transcriptional regulator